MNLIPLLAADAAQRPSGTIGTAIIVAALAMAVFFAVRGFRKHLKGEGGCCGGGGDHVPPEAKEIGKTVATRTLSIGGMHCMHCVRAVTEALNAIDGVSADVDLQSARATVRMDRPVDDATLRAAVEKAGFRVTD